jgi:hypothetical protein
MFIAKQREFIAEQREIIALVRGAGADRSLRRLHSARRQAGGASEIRNGFEPQDRQSARPRNPGGFDASADEMIK